MANYPTLSIGPVYPLDQAREDNTIKSSAEAGYVLSRPRFTRARRSWTLKYKNMPQADVNTLDAAYNSAPSSIISWTHPETAATVNVRFAAPPKFSLTKPGFYDADVTLAEV